jgi:hypothetical protein
MTAPEQRKLVFLTGQTPEPGLMSGPIYLRILEYLAQKFDTYCASFGGSQEIPKLIELPYRQWWWPPSRIANAHTQLRARYLAKALKLTSADRALAAYPFEGMSIAQWLKRLLGIQYSVLVHDLHREYLDRDDVRSALAQASSVLCVSDSLAKVMGDYNSNSTVLLPTPGQDLGLFPEFSTAPIGLAGGFNSHYVEIIARFGLPVLAIGDAPEEAAIRNVRYVPRFSANDDAVRFASDNCSAFCVIVPHGWGDYELYSFPSRLLDFCRAGLPVIIVASTKSPVGRWAQDQAWPLYVCDEQDLSQFQAVTNQLRNRSTWERAQQRVMAIRENNFSYESINKQMLTFIL